MKIYERNEKGWFCGYWNGENIAIYLHTDKHDLYADEKLHYHKDYSEYYLVTEGSMFMQVDRETAEVCAGQLIVVDPGECHQVLRFGPDGCKYAVIKERDYADGTKRVDDPGTENQY